MKNSLRCRIARTFTLLANAQRALEMFVSRRHGSGEALRVVDCDVRLDAVSHALTAVTEPLEFCIEKLGATDLNSCLAVRRGEHRLGDALARAFRA